MRNKSALDDTKRLNAEKGRLPSHQIGHLAGLDGAYIFIHAERACRVYGVFGDIALDALIISILGFFVPEATALIAHFTGQLPAPRNHLIDATHALAIGAKHGNRAQVMQHVFGHHGLRAHTAFGKGDILG